MGDISFSLTLKSRIEEETNKIIKELNKVDSTGKQAQNVLEAISEATKGIGDKGGAGFKKLSDFISELRNNIKIFSSEDFFSPKKVQQLEAVENGLYRIGRILEDVSKKGTGFSIFPNNVSTEENKAERELYKLSSFINEINKRRDEGMQMLGANSTSVIRQSLSDLSKYRAELEQIKNNGGIHPITGLTASDVVKSAGYLNAIDEAKVYAKVVKDAIKQEADEYTRRQKQGSQHLDQLNKEGLALQKNAQIQQKLTELQEKAWISQTKSGFRGGRYLTPGNAEAAQGYRDIANAYKTSANQLQSKYNEDKANFSKQLDEYAKTYKAIEDKLRAISPNMDGRGIDGKGLKGKDRSYYEGLVRDLAYMKKGAESEQMANISNLENQASKIKELIQLAERYNQLAEQVSKSTYKPYDSNSYEQKRISDTAALKNAILERYKAEQDAEKKRKKDEADAAREAKAAEKQRQNELKNTEHRYDSLGNKVRQLRSEYSRGISIGADVSKAEAEIKRLLFLMRGLRAIRDRLNSENWRDYVGALGSIGSGHDTTLASRVLQDQRAVNREVQRGVELEQKRQQEIAKSAAKARNDLAAAFAGANAEAKKMQSIVGDIKSLFLQGGIVFGAQQFFNSIVQTGGEIVQQHVALRSILGDVQKADELFAQTQQLALQSPFKFGELNRDVKQLAAFGVEANDLYDTTKRLADIASGLGVDFGRLGLAFGQVKARSWLDGKELRQFAYAGLPLLQKITELYNSEGKNGRKNYTQADVKKMISGRQVSFEDVQKVLWKMTDEGGQFYNMQFVLSETLLGRWNKLIDAWDIMLGKFAEGKNIVGGTFSFLINRTTDLVLALDKVSNAALAFGAMYALRKGATAIASRVGISSNLAALHAEQQVKLRTFAVEQQQALIEGKITQEKMRQNIADYQGMLNSKINTRNAVEQAALEGRLSALKMQKAFREGLISKEMIEQLRLMGMISAKEAELITKEGTRARMSLAVNQAKGKLGGFFSGWNIATLGITIGTALYSAYSQFKDSIKQDTDRINETAKTTVKTLSDTLSEVGNKGTGETLQQQVDKMTDVLKQSGLYTDSIKEQIDSTDDLGKEYDILKQKIIDAKNENNFTPGEGGNFAKAKKASGAGFAGGASWFGQWTGVGQDDIDENINDVAENLTQLQMKMEKFGNSTKSSMEKVANSMLGARAAGMTFEEKLYTLYKTGGNGAATWRIFVDKVSNGNKDMKKSLENLEDDLRHFGVNFREIATDDIPKYLEYMAKSRNMDMVEFSRWCKQHPDKFRTMLDQMLSEANKKVPGLVARLQSVAMAILNIGKAKPQEGNTGPKVWKNPNKVGTIERKAFDKLQKAGKLKGGKGGFWQKEMAEYLRNLNGGNSNGWTSFGEAVRKRYKEVRDENDNAKNAGDRQPYIREQRMLETIAAQSGISLDVGKNKVTGHFGKNKNKNGRQEDVELKRLQERIDLYKKMYAEIKKFKELYGEGALGQLANDGEFGAIFGDKKRFPISDYTNYETSIKELLKGFSLSTPERKHYAETQKAAIQSENRKLLQDQRRDELDLLNRELDVISAQYDTYKKLYELTGNKKGAENIAFDGVVQYDTYKKFLEKQLDIAVKHDNVQSGLKLATDEVKGMSLDNVKDRYGSESRVYDIRKKLDDETRKIKQETIDLLANLVEKNATIDQQIEDENRKYERQLELIKGIKDTGMRDRATEGAEKTHNENLAKLEFERFKQGSDWVTIFDDLDRVSSTTINSMVEKIDEFSKTTGLSVEVVKQLRDALGKLRDEQIDRNPINGIIGGMQRGNAIGSFIDSRFRKGMDISTTTYVGADDAKKMGIQKGNYTKGQLEGEQKGAYADANKAVSKLAEKFKALQDCLSPVINLFEVLGEEDSFLGQATSTASGALGAAAQVSGGLNALGLGNLGPYGAAAGAALSVVTSLFAMHDKALQKEIEASEERQKEFDNMTKNIKSIIEDTLGGIYSYKVSDDTKNTLNKVTSDYERSVAWKNSKTGKNFPFLFNSIYSSKTYEAAKDAQSKPNSAYHAELASLMAQRDELQSQRDSESKKKKKDNSKIADYNQQIKEMEQQINTFAQDFLKDIYSIDIKSWASELTDAVVGAWEKGEDAVEAYREKVKDMVKDVTKNIVTQKIMESALQEPLNYLTGILKDKGKLDETDMDKLADMLYKAGDEVVPQITGLYDAFKKRGWDFRDNGSSSSTKNSIQSITEETADIIASYLNSIRLYCAEDNTNLKQLAELTKSALPEISVIAKSQLTAMNQLVSLAEYRNDRLDDMYSWMRSVTKDTGSKSLRIS